MKVTLEIDLPEEDITQLKTVASSLNRSVDWLIEYIVQRYVIRNLGKQI